MFFDDAYGLLRVLIVGPLAYLALVIMLRVSGKRTLSKMNAFDFVVTVAIGSMLASIILTESVALVEGVMGMAMLLVLQFIVTWLSVRSERVSDLVKADPTLLYHNGRYVQSQLTRTRVAKTEIQQAIRSQGKGSLDDVVSVVLETDGTFSVVTSLPEGKERPVGVSRQSEGA